MLSSLSPFQNKFPFFTFLYAICRNWADDPNQKIKLKSFHCEIINDKNALHVEEKHFKELPVISNITPVMVLKKYYRIKQEIDELIETEIEALLNTPGKENILLD